MKKLCFVLAIMMAALFSSCEKEHLDFDPNDPTEYCYHIEYTVSAAGVSETEDDYYWGTGSEVDKMVTYIKELYSGIATITFNVTKVNMTQSQCWEKEYD